MIAVIPSAVQIVLYLASEVLFILAPLDMILEVFDNFLVSGVIRCSRFILCISCLNTGISH